MDLIIEKIHYLRSLFLHKLIAERFIHSEMDCEILLEIQDESKSYLTHLSEYDFHESLYLKPFTISVMVVLDKW